MVQYIQQKNIDRVKYDACIQQAKNSRIFAYSWYLDIVADHWDVLVLNDYEAVMPLPWRSKYFIKYVYQPLWNLQLGIFYVDFKPSDDSFLEVLFHHFRYVYLRLNPENNLNIYSKECIKNQMQFISLQDSYDTILNNYNRNRKRDLQKAEKSQLSNIWSDCPTKLIELFKNNVGKRIPKIIENDYSNLLKVMDTSIEKGVGELLTIYDSNNKLIASAFFLKHKNVVTELVCSSDFSDRYNGANTYMNDVAISKYAKNFEVFNFGGSSMENIANFYKSFNASTEYYSYINYNNLPFLIKLFKK